MTGVELNMMLHLSKIRENIWKSYKELFSIIDVYTRYREKFCMCFPAIELLILVATWFGQNTWKVAQIGLMLFKGPGSFKEKF